MLAVPGDQRCRIDAQASEEDPRRILRVVGGAQVTLEGLEFENGWVAHTGTEAQAAAAGTVNQLLSHQIHADCFVQ